jgi:Protein of unknown function (DUF1236)
MMKQVSMALAAGLLVAGVSTASAAGMQSSTATTKMSHPASDTLSLTSTQRKMAWNDLHSQATEQKAPANFKETVGAIVPSTIKIEPVPSKATSNGPALKSYDFARVNGKLLIVNPSDKKVAEVIGD